MAIPPTTTKRSQDQSRSHFCSFLGRAHAPARVRLYAAVRRSRNVRTLNFPATRYSAQPAGELRSRAHAELRVDMGQVAGDRPLCDETGRRRPPGSCGPLQPGRRRGARRASAPPRACGRRSARARCEPSRPRSRPRAASKPSSAAWIASRASRFFRARLRTTPSPSSARAVPNGSPTSSCCATARSRREPARGTSPSAAATRPRHRVTCANTHSRATRAASASQTSTTRTASSIRPSSRSISA